MNVIYLVKEATKHYTLQAYESVEMALEMANTLNNRARKENKRYRFYVEAVSYKESEE